MTTTSGTITYKKLMIAEHDAANIASFLGYKEEGNDWYVYRVPRLSVNCKKAFEDNGMQVYLPTYKRTIQSKAFSKAKSNSDCIVRTVETPKILDYVFVLANENQVNALAKLLNICPVYCHHDFDELKIRQKEIEKLNSLKTNLEVKLFNLSKEKNSSTSNESQKISIKDQIKKTLAKLNALNDSQNKNTWERWTKVPNKQMHSLMIIVQGLEQDMEFCTPAEQVLDKGDKVKVVGGRFKGVEGILITNQGSNSGQVYVSVTNGIGAMTAKIQDKYVQVLEFSRNTNHFYYKIAAFEKLLDQYLQIRSKGQRLNSEQEANLRFFLFRYESLTGLTRVNAAKLVACRYVAYKLLGQHTEADLCLQFHDEECNSTKKNQRAAKRSKSGQEYIDKWVERVRQSQRQVS